MLSEWAGILPVAISFTSSLSITNLNVCGMYNTTKHCNLCTTLSHVHGFLLHIHVQYVINGKTASLHGYVDQYQHDVSCCWSIHLLLTFLLPTMLLSNVHYTSALSHSYLQCCNQSMRNLILFYTSKNYILYWWHSDASVHDNLCKATISRAP